MYDHGRRNASQIWLQARGRFPNPRVEEMGALGMTKQAAPKYAYI